MSSVNVIMTEETNGSPPNDRDDDNVDTDETSRTMINPQNRLDGPDGVEDTQQPKESLVPSPEHPLPKSEISEHSQSSNFQNLDKPQNSNLDDVLGPKGMLPDAELGRSSDLDDILGPQTVSKLSSDLDDTLGPYEASTIGISIMSLYIL